MSTDKLLAGAWPPVKKISAARLSRRTVLSILAPDWVRRWAIVSIWVSDKAAPAGAISVETNSSELIRRQPRPFRFRLRIPCLRRPRRRIRYLHREFRFRLRRRIHVAG